MAESFATQIKHHLVPQLLQVVKSAESGVLGLRCHLLDIFLQSHTGFTPNTPMSGGRGGVLVGGRSAIDKTVFSAIYVLELFDVSNNKTLLRVANSKQLKSSGGHRFSYSKVYEPMLEVTAKFIAENADTKNLP